MNTESNNKSRLSLVNKSPVLEVPDQLRPEYSRVSLNDKSL